MVQRILLPARLRWTGRPVSRLRSQVTITREVAGLATPITILFRRHRAVSSDITHLIAVVATPGCALYTITYCSSMRSGPLFHGVGGRLPAEGILHGGAGTNPEGYPGSLIGLQFGDAVWLECPGNWDKILVSSSFSMALVVVDLPVKSVTGPPSCSNRLMV